MINFVEELPKEWEPKWTQIKADAGRVWVSLPGMSLLIQLSLKTDMVI
jgi:hypothetical protein